MVLHPHEIASTFLELDLWAGFIPIISTKGINQKKNGNCKKKINSMHTKRFIILLKAWVQFHVGAILRLPNGRVRNMMNKVRVIQ